MTTHPAGLAWPLVFVTACGFGLVSEILPDTANTAAVDDTEGEDSDTDDDTDTSSSTDTDSAEKEPAFAVTSIDPTYGMTDGGEEVVITGGPFGSSTRVWFGDEEGIVSEFVKQITVTSPAQSSSGNVDVTIRTDAGEVNVEDSFYYFADGTGLAGAIGHLSWYDYDENSWSKKEDVGHAYVSFIDPEDIHWWSLYGETLDSCTASSFPERQDLGLSALQMTSDSSSEVELTWSESALMDPGDSDTVEGFVAENLSSDQLQAGATFALAKTEEGMVPSFSAESLFKFPQQANILEPTFNSSSQIEVNNLRIRWPTNDSGDAMLIKAMIVDKDDSILDTVTCAAADDGEFQIDSTYWSNWQADQSIILQLGRIIEGSGTLPLSKAELRVGGIYWTVARGKTR